MASSFVLGGLKLADEQHFSWKIENFTTMLSDTKAIDAQGFEFRVGGNDPNISSYWSICLTSYKGTDYIGIYYKKVNDCDSNENIYTECSYAVKNQKREQVLSTRSKAFGPLKTLTCQVGPGQWFPCATLRELLDNDDSFTIHCIFKLFTIHAKRAIYGTVQKSLDRFHEKSKAKVPSLFAKLLEEKSLCENVTILTMDMVEIKAYKDILEVRSPVFEAMFRSHMKEKAEGVIQLKEFTADAVRVLLHYIYTGELLPNWSNMDILLQLVNAAEKYQFPDLLDFFDCVLPSLCDNVDAAKLILQIAVQFRLKKAEVRILEFLKERLEKIKTGEEFLNSVQDRMLDDASD